MKTSAILGITGGIFGIFGGLFAVMFGTAFDSEGTIGIQGWVAIAASAAAIFTSTQVKKNAKRSGWLLIIAGIVGLVAISFFYILPAILLVIAGIVALSINKNKKTAKS